MDNVKITTNCKGCVFAVSDDLGQTGCLANRVNPSSDFISSRSAESGFFILDRYCSLFRPEKWVEELNLLEQDRTSEKLLKVAKKEALPRLTFIINFNYDMSFLTNLLDIINSQECRKFIVVVNDKVEYNENIFALLKDKLSNNVGGFNLVQIVKSSSKFYDSGFKHAKNGWSVFLDKNQTVGKNFVGNLEERLTNQWKRLVFAQDESGERKIVQSSIYKMLLNNVKSDGSIDSRPFEEKILDLEFDDKDCFCDWKEIFDE